MLFATGCFSVVHVAAAPPSICLLRLLMCRSCVRASNLERLLVYSTSYRNATVAGQLTCTAVPSLACEYARAGRVTNQRLYHVLERWCEKQPCIYIRYNADPARYYSSSSFF